MRTAVSLAAISILAVAAVAGQSGARQPAANASPSTARVGTMSELMIHIIYPTSDAVFYISSRTPTSDAEWTALQASTLTLAESANLLMMPGRTRAGQWNADSRMMLDAAWGAFKAAKVKDLEGVEASAISSTSPASPATRRIVSARLRQAQAATDKPPKTQMTQRKTHRGQFLLGMQK
jgi:hypothetical protein